MEKKVLIYCLMDPLTGEIRYVGQTIKGNKRFKEHIKPSSLRKHTHKNHWIKSLINKDLKPIFNVLEYIEDNSILDEREDYWINYHKSQGCNLTNAANGGRGSPGRKNSPESIAKMSRAAKARNWEGFVPHNKKIIFLLVKLNLVLVVDVKKFIL